MSARPSRTRRLLGITLYAGCVGAGVFALRPILSAEPVVVPPLSSARPPTDIGPFRLPPGTWNVLSAGQLNELRQLARGEAVSSPPSSRCPLVPPGFEPLAERTDAAGRVSAFLTGPVEWTPFTRHWTDGGWLVVESRDPEHDTRTLTLSRGTERALAWVFPADHHPDRVQLLVTVTDPRTEDRP